MCLFVLHSLNTCVAPMFTTTVETLKWFHPRKAPSCRPSITTLTSLCLPLSSILVLGNHRYVVSFWNFATPEYWIVWAFGIAFFFFFPLSTPWRFNQVVTFIDSLWFFYCWTILHSMSVPPFFIQSPVEGHLDWFSFLAVANKAAITLYTGFWKCKCSFLWDMCPKAQSLSSVVVSCLIS